VTRVVVAGAIANKPWNGGAAWTRLSFALGLRKLGFDVWFIERIAPEHCVDADGKPAHFHDSENLAYFQRVLSRSGLIDSSALILGAGELVHGSSWANLMDVASDAELLLDISGHLASTPLMRLFGRTLYIDTDPGFTQLWHASGSGGARLDGHDFFFTVGENIGTPGCPVPTDGVGWHAIRQPVVLDEWPASEGARRRAFSTVASWRGAYGRIGYDGTTYGLTVHEFRKFIGLPERTGMPFEIALDIDDADGRDLDSLVEHGWTIVDPRTHAGDPGAFRAYVQTSWAEFSAAQGIYVDTQNGWFSDRTARYLASGKPVLVQDTGFGTNLPDGTGLLPFRTPEEAEAGARSIRDDYEAQAAAARLQAARTLEAIGITRQRRRGELPRLPRVPTAEATTNPLAVQALSLTAAAPLAPVDGKTDILAIGMQEALPELESAVSDPDPQVRLAALEAIETYGPKAVGAKAGLVRALRDSNRYVRWAATRILGKVDPAEAKEAVPELARLLNDPDLRRRCELEPDQDVRMNAAMTLERFGPAAAAAAPALTRSISEGDAEEREKVIYARAAVGQANQAVISALAGQLTHDDPRVRRAAADALGRFAPTATIGRDTKAALVKALDDEDAEVRRAAADALANTPSSQKGR